MKLKKVELLSPAGNYDCMCKALANGADAIYLAGQKYGARAYAGNFSQDELLKALDIAHLYDKKIYLTVNTVLKQGEMGELYDFINPFYENGLDGVIVQDLGVVKAMRDMFPHMETHASTQMSITSVYGAELLKEMGITRVVPAREISLAEISDIIQKTGIEVEAFIHGAMCYAYSGKCLFSSFLGGRSGNRGRCAQPCRLTYNGCYPLSMKDMYTLDVIPDLIKAGISSFKIEGRMKSPEYVACVTGIYRKYIDMYYDSPELFSVDKVDEKLIMDVYTRSGNCNGYYFKNNGKDMITMSQPGYNGAKENANTSKQFVDKELKKLSVDVYGNFNINGEASLTLNYKDIYVTETENIVEPSKENPTNIETIKRQIKKTGGTQFVVNNCELSGDEEIFVPLKSINELRRNAFKKLEKIILESSRRKNEGTEFNNKCDILKCQDEEDNDNRTKYCIFALKKENIIQVLKYDADCEVVVPSSALFLDSKPEKIYEIDKEICEAIKTASSNSKKIILRLPRVLRKKSITSVENALELARSLNINSVMISNLDELGFLLSGDFDGEIIADEHLYFTNKNSAYYLLDKGIDYLTYSIELNQHELIENDVKGQYLIVYGKTPLMISAQCIKNTLDGCKRKQGFTYIKDRKNISFPVFNVCSECTNIIFNSVPTLLDVNANSVNKLTPGKFRLDFIDETPEITKQILDYFLKGKNRIPVKEYTRGHFIKGVE